MASTTSELERLVEIYEKGLLTRTEFDQQKALLLQTSSGQPPSLPRSSGAPTAIGAYKLLGVIGQGGMGTVYRARHIAPTRAEEQGGDVALKLLHPGLSQRADFQERFQREAMLGLRLSHPNLMRVLDLIIDGGTLALVMEYIEGRPLSQIIGEEVGPIPWSQARPLFEQLLSGVGYAHEHDIIHRDLKPENVLVTADNTLKIIDFGIAREGQGSTKTGIMGTVDYMSPEQYTNPRGVDHRADIYALGMTLYEMLAGRLPWERSEVEYAVMRMKSEGKLPPASQWYPYIPDNVLHAMQRALAVDPAQRFDSTAGFVKAFSAPVVEPAPVPMAPAPAPAARPTPARPTPAPKPSPPQPAPRTTVQTGESVIGLEVREQFRLFRSLVRSLGVFTTMKVLLHGGYFLSSSRNYLDNFLILGAYVALLFLLVQAYRLKRIPMRIAGLAMIPLAGVLVLYLCDFVFYSSRGIAAASLNTVALGVSLYTLPRFFTKFEHERAGEEILAALHESPEPAMRHPVEWGMIVLCGVYLFVALRGI